MALTYNIYQDGEKIATDVTETTYTATGLEPSETYSFQVSATDTVTNLESELSEPITVTTEDEEEPEPEEPDSPEGLSSSDTTSDSTTLNWE